MRKLVVYLLALPLLMSGCVRAHFSPLVQEAGTEGSPDEGPADALVCPAPTATCSTPTNLITPCDPSCQTGNCKWCEGEKCAVSGSDGDPICIKATGTSVRGDGCNITNLGQPTQFDTCARGFICMGDYASVPQNTHCFQLCQSLADCNGVNGVLCNKRPVAPPTTVGVLPFTALVCDPDYKTCSGAQPPYANCCNPTNGKGCDLGEICYLVAQADLTTGNNRTVCEYWSGGGGINSTCSSSTDCEVGWFCSSNHCVMACDPTAANPCNGVGRCNMFGNQFGGCGN
jgi:hypothetical protein